MAANNNYASFAGFIQFEPSERQVNNQTVRAVVISAIGSNRRIDVTVWPDFEDVPLSQGDFIAVQGKYSERVQQKPSGESVTYRNLSANKLENLSLKEGGTTAPKAKQKDAPAAAEDFDF